MPTPPRLTPHGAVVHAAVSIVHASTFAAATLTLVALAARLILCGAGTLEDPTILLATALLVVALAAFPWDEADRCRWSRR
jgi:hypothetical protein